MSIMNAYLTLSLVTQVPVRIRRIVTEHRIRGPYLPCKSQSQGSTQSQACQPVRNEIRDKESLGSKAYLDRRSQLFSVIRGLSRISNSEENWIFWRLTNAFASVH